MIQWIVLCVQMIHCIVVTSDQAILSLPTAGLITDLSSILHAFPKTRLPVGFWV